MPDNMNFNNGNIPGYHNPPQNMGQSPNVPPILSPNSVSQPSMPQLAPAAPVIPLAPAAPAAPQANGGVPGPAMPSYTPAPEGKPSEKKNGKSQEKKSKKGRVVRVILCCILAGCFAGLSSMTLYTYFVRPKLEAEAVAAAERVANKNQGGSDSPIKRRTTRKKAVTTIFEGERDSVILDKKIVDTSETYTPAEIYAANVNSTVGITTSIDVNYYGYKTTAAAAGSGFILTEDGYIVTNHHVIEDGKDIKVTTYDGTIYDAELIGYDMNDDLAVLKINASGLVPVILGDSSKLNVGDGVLAIGNPLGELTFTLTTGVVSASRRSITIQDRHMYLMQTDCAINSGNSGGPLFNMHGEVIGITNAKYSSLGVENIGFAIPINNARDIIFSMIQRGYYTKPDVGFETEAAYISSKYPINYGIGIFNLKKDSTGDAAGLQNSDVIVQINSVPVNNPDDLYFAVVDAGIGNTITLLVYRDGDTFEVELEVGEIEYPNKE